MNDEIRAPIAAMSLILISDLKVIPENFAEVVIDAVPNIAAITITNIILLI